MAGPPSAATGRQMFRHLVRAHYAWSESDLLDPAAHALLWGVLLDSAKAGRALAEALEADPSHLELPLSEFVRWSTALPGMGEGKAGKVAAALALVGHVHRILGDVDGGEAPGVDASDALRWPS